MEIMNIKTYTFKYDINLSAIGAYKQILKP